MRALLPIILFVTLCSCSSSATFYINDVPFLQQHWRWCTAEKDGGSADKGWCYISMQCKKKLFKDKCIPFPLFCAFGDIECLKKYQFDKKVVRLDD